MNVRISRLLALGVALAVFGSSGAATALAAPVPVKVSIPNLRCIQTYAASAGDDEDDAVYLSVTGVAKGAEVAKRLPESGTLAANRKKPPVTEKEPLTLWEGELADGEFALVTVALFQGKGDDAGKAFADKLGEAAKGVAGRSKATVTAEEFATLAAATKKAQHAVAVGARETLSREKNTDHFNGLFNVLVWNNNGTVVKRLDPLGLIHGEHYGSNDPKSYTKLKWTRLNVLVPDPDGQYYPQELPPITEDKLTVRVKMLENESFKNEKGRRTKVTTDYLADVQVSAAGKPVEWKLGDEVLNPIAEKRMKIHIYWEWAE